MRATRRNLTQIEQRKAAQVLARKFNQNTNLKYAKCIALYLANDGEVSTDNTIKKAWKNKQQVYLPVLDPIRKGFLWFVEYRPDSRMRNNRFGIAEPDPKFNKRINPKFLSAVGLPLVAFDSNGNRLGMGGGFYDRSFEFCRRTSIKPKLFGLAHRCQQVKSLPLESWDIQLEEIICV